MKVPGKIRNFLWRLAKHSIPTEDVRLHKKMATEDRCQICGAQDSWRHSLLDCTMARCMWALTKDDISSLLQATTEGNTKRWIFSLIETMPHTLLIKTVVTLWAIWSARRKAIHEGILQSPHATNSFITSFIAELEAINVANTHQPGQQTMLSRSAEVRYEWREPPPGMAKIHVDGGLARVGNGGSSAALCRDHDGTYLGSSAMVFSDIHDPATLEALACREAMALAHDLSLRRIVIACDCKTVVEEIHKGSAGPYSVIIKEIEASAKDFESCVFIFESRVLNFEAHSLVKFSSSLVDGRHVWLGLPHDPFVIPVNRTPS